MDLKLELVAVPVSDVDRAKAFYTDQAGFHADHDFNVSDEIRFVQLTPPGSACSIAIGKGLTDAAPGSVQGLQLVVTDIEAARKEFVDRGGRRGRRDRGSLAPGARQARAGAAVPAAVAGERAAVGHHARARRRRAGGGPGRAHRDRGGLPGQGAAAVLLRLARRVGQRSRGRAVSAGELGTAVVPRGVRRCPPRLADVPGRPDPPAHARRRPVRPPAVAVRRPCGVGVNARRNRWVAVPGADNGIRAGTGR